MPVTINELNKRYGTSGVTSMASDFSGKVPSISELNSYNEKKRKEEEEQRRKEQEQQQQAATRQKEAEVRIKQKEDQNRMTEIDGQNAVLRQAPAAKPGFWEKVKTFFGVEPSIRDTMMKQEKAREQVKKEEIKKLGGGVVESAVEGFQSGSLGLVSMTEATASVLARKVKAEKLAKKLDIEAQENRRYLQDFNQEYRQDILSDKYSTLEKMKATPVRYIAGVIGEASASTFAPLAVGAAASYLGAPVIAATGISAGMSSLLSFGSAYQDAREYGLEEGEAEKIGFMTALMTAPLDYIPEFRLFKKLGGKETEKQIVKAYTKNVTEEILKRTAKAGTSALRQSVYESITESGQTVVENAWVKTYNDNRGLFEGVDQAALSGFFMGGMMDTLVSSTSSLQNAVREKTGQEPGKRGINGIQIEDIPEQTIPFVEPPIEEEPVVAQALLAEQQKEEQLMARKENENSEQFAARFAKEQPEEFKKRYLKRIASEFNGAKNVVAADEAKFAIPGFDATQSAAYHETSSNFAKKYAEELLADQTTMDKDVLILGGGSGAGKTSGLELSVKNKGMNLDDFAMVYDANIASEKSGVTRIESSLKTGRDVIMQYTYRDPVEAFANGVIPRTRTKGRIVPIDVHMDNYFGSRDAFDKLVQRYKDNPKVEFVVVDNSRGKGNTKLVGVDELPALGYTKDELKEKLYEEINKAKAEGKITDAEYETYIKAAAPRESEQAGQNNSRSPEQPEITNPEAEVSKFDTAEEFVNKYAGDPSQEQVRSENFDTLTFYDKPHGVVEVSKLEPYEYQNFSDVKNETNGAKDVADMVKFLKENPDKELAPVLIDSEFSVLDGMHRTQAYIEAGREKIPFQYDRDTLKKIYNKSKTSVVQIKELIDVEGDKISETTTKIPAGEKSVTTGPIDVVKTSDGYMVLDGQHRASEAFNSGKTDIEVNVLKSDVALAKYGDRWPQIKDIILPKTTQKDSKTIQTMPISKLVDPEELLPVSELSYNIDEKDKSFSKGAIDVVKAPEGYVILDGRHRAVEAFRNNETNIDVNVLSREEAIQKYGEDWPQLEQVIPTGQKRKTGEGITKTSGLAASIRERAIRKRLTTVFEGLPEYETLNIAEASTKIAKLINEDYGRAKAIAMGTEKPLPGTTANLTLKAVEDQAIADRDVNTIRDLATMSTLSYETSIAAQELRSLAERDPDSPVAAIQSVVKAREEAVQKEMGGKDIKVAKKEAAAEIKAEIKKQASVKKWTDFVNSLAC